MNKNVKASTWYLFGNLFDKAIAFLTIPIFTRMFTTSEYGVVSTYISYVSILAIVLGLSMDSSIQNAYFDFQDDIESYVSTTIIAAGIFTLIFLAFIFIFVRYVDGGIPIVLIPMAIIQGFMMYVLNVAKMYYMMQVKYIQRVILMSVPHTLISFLSVWGIMMCDTDKYMGRIIPYVLVIAIFGIYIGIFFWRKAKNKFKKEYFSYAIKYSLPLVFHGLSLQILAQCDKIMLSSMRSSAETGIYSLIYNVGLVSQVFTNAFDNAWLPWYQRKMNEENRAETINKNATRLMIIVAVIVIGIVILSPEIIKILATEEYWSGTTMVVPIIGGTYIMFMYTLEVHTEYYYKSTKQIPLYTAIAAFSNFVLNFIFIPSYGALAAAYTSLVSYGISFVLHYRAAHKCNKSVLPFNVFIIPSVMVVAGSIFMVIFIDKIFVRWSVAITIGVFFLIYSFKNDLLHSMLKD